MTFTPFLAGTSIKFKPDECNLAHTHEHDTFGAFIFRDVTAENPPPLPAKIKNDPSAPAGLTIL